MAFDFSEFVKCKDGFFDVQKGFELWLKKWLIKKGYHLIGIAKFNTPTDTSLLKNSYYVGDSSFTLSIEKKGKNKGQHYVTSSESATPSSVKKNGGEYKIEVGNNVEYAVYVEYGHMSKNGGGFVEGYMMLTIASSKVEDSLEKDFIRDFERWWKSNVKK